MHDKISNILPSISQYILHNQELFKCKNISYKFFMNQEINKSIKDI